MPKLNITQAAKAVGKDRRTIQRHINQNKLSYETTGQGKKLVDTSELLRVYGELKNSDATPDEVRQDAEKSQRAAGQNGKKPLSAAPNEMKMLRQRTIDLEQQVTELRIDKEDLKQDKETDRKEKVELLSIIKQQQKTIEHQQTLLLPAPAETEVGESVPVPEVDKRKKEAIDGTVIEVRKEPAKTPKKKQSTQKQQGTRTAKKKPGFFGRMFGRG